MQQSPQMCFFVFIVAFTDPPLPAQSHSIHVILTQSQELTPRTANAFRAQTNHLNNSELECCNANNLGVGILMKHVMRVSPDLVVSSV